MEVEPPPPPSSSDSDSPHSSVGSNSTQEPLEPQEPQEEPQTPIVFPTFPIVSPPEVEDAALGLGLGLGLGMGMDITGSPLLHPPLSLPLDTDTAPSLPPQSFASYHSQDFFEVQSSGPVDSTAAAATTSASLCPFLNDEKEGFKWDIESTKNNEDGSTTYLLNCHHRRCYASKRVTVTCTMADDHQEKCPSLRLSGDPPLPDGVVCPVYAQNQNWVLLGGDLKNDTKKKSEALTIYPKKDADDAKMEMEKNYVLQCPHLFCQARKSLNVSVHVVNSSHSHP